MLVVVTTPPTTFHTLGKKSFLAKGSFRYRSFATNKRLPSHIQYWQTSTIVMPMLVISAVLVPIVVVIVPILLNMNGDTIVVLLVVLIVHIL